MLVPSLPAMSSGISDRLFRKRSAYYSRPSCAICRCRLPSGSTLSDRLYDVLNGLFPNMVFPVSCHGRFFCIVLRCGPTCCTNRQTDGFLHKKRPHFLWRRSVVFSNNRHPAPSVCPLSRTGFLSAVRDDSGRLFACLFNGPVLVDALVQFPDGLVSVASDR